MIARFNKYNANSIAHKQLISYCVNTEVHVFRVAQALDITTKH